MTRPACLPAACVHCSDPACLPACCLCAGAVDFWWSHALISDESADGIKATCNFSTVGPLRAGQQGELQQGSSKGKKYCDEYVDQVGG